MFITYYRHICIETIFMSILINKQNNDKFKFKNKVFTLTGNNTTFISADKRSVV